MSKYHTDEEVRNYDIFKGVVTALLLVTLFLAFMLGAGTDGDTGSPETEPGAVQEGYPAAQEVAGSETEAYPAEGESYPSQTAESAGEEAVAETGGEAYPGQADSGQADSGQADSGQADSGEAGSIEPGAQGGEVTQEPETAAPSLLSPAPESNPEPGTQTFSGMGTPGTEVVVLADGVELGSTTVSENGTWELEVDLPEGTETIELQALDEDGNVVATSGDIYLTTEAAEAAAGEEAAEPPVVEQPASPVPAFNPLTGSIILEGASAAGATVAALVDDEVVAQATAGEDGQWQLNLDLEPGFYDLAFGRLDEEGNVTSKSEPVSIEVPAEMPQIDLPDYSLPDEALAAIDAAEAGTEAAEGEAQAAGEGVRSALDSIQLPDIKLPAGPFEWTGSAAPGDDVALVVDGEVAGTATSAEDGSFTLPGTLAAGLSSLQLALVGEDGEFAATSKAITADISDMQLPTMQLPALTGSEETVTVSGTANPGSTVEVTANGQKVADALAGADGAWVASIAAFGEAVRLRVQALGEDGLPVLQSMPIQLPGSSAGVAEAPADVVAEAPGEVATLTPPEEEGEAPGEVATVAPSEDEAETSDEGETEAPGEVATVTPPDDEAEAPAEAEAPVESQTEVDFEVGAQSAVEATEVSGDFSILLDGLEQAGLTQTLADVEGAYTLFAPTDEAFEALPPGIMAGWEVYPEVFTDILSNLVVEGSYPPETLVDGLVLRSVVGTNIGITRDGDMIYVNGVPVVDAAETGQSVVYALPQVVLPPLPAGISAPIIDESGVPYYVGETLTVVGRGEPGMRIVLAVEEERFGEIAMIDQNGFWLAEDEIDGGIHRIVAFMIDDRGLVQAISPEVVLAVPESE